MPHVSVIMPAYNARRYVGAAVRSILDQTYRDFEFIVIDDGSTDGTTDILRGLAAEDTRVRLVTRPNTGYVRALIEAASLANAPLMARMDADDVAAPDRFAKQVAAFAADPSLVLLGGAYDFVDERGRLIRRWRQPTDHASLDAVALRGGNPFCHPLTMFRRDAYERVGGYDIAFEPAEDLDLWLRLAEVGRVSALPDVLLDYRQHAASVSQTKQSRQMDRIRVACEAAWKRRGLAALTFDAKPWRASGSRASLYAQHMQFGWWAFESRSRAAARTYARRGIALMPWRAEAWKLLACVTLKSHGDVANGDPSPVADRAGFDFDRTSP